MRRISEKSGSVHHGGHRAAHGDHAGSPRAAMLPQSLSSLSRQKLDGFCHPGVGVLGQKDPAGRPVFRAQVTCLAPVTFWQTSDQSASPLGRLEPAPTFPIPTEFARQK